MIRTHAKIEEGLRYRRYPQPLKLFSQMPEIAGDEMHIRPRAFQYFFRASDCIGIQIETDQHSLFPNLPAIAPACPAPPSVASTTQSSGTSDSESSVSCKRTGTCPAPTKAGGVLMTPGRWKIVSVACA